MRETVVYALSHKSEPERVRYVGRTVQGVKVRLQEHWRDARNPTLQNPIHRWFRKHQDTPEAIQVRILSRHESMDDVNAAEIKAIAEHRASGMADLNILDGGRAPWAGSGLRNSGKHS